MIEEIIRNHTATQGYTYVAALLFTLLRDMLNLHFHDIMTASCGCGFPCETHDLWVDHVLAVLGKPA